MVFLPLFPSVYYATKKILCSIARIMKRERERERENEKSIFYIKISFFYLKYTLQTALLTVIQFKTFSMKTDIAFFAIKHQGSFTSW